MKNEGVIIIGGGASGMMAGIQAARQGMPVRILEHNERLGKKILVTGNGRCNLTNTDQDISNYRCRDRNFITEILEQFDFITTMRFFSSLGIYTKNRDGYIYPASGQASAVLDVLRMELERLKVKIHCNSHVVKIEKQDQFFHVHTEDYTYESAACILACGGKAGAIAGADGSGYALAEKLGHYSSPVVPSLVQLRAEENFFKSLAGVRANASVSLYIDDSLTAQDVGEVQFTAYGISGIPTFQLSRWAASGISERKEVSAVLNFMPDFEKKQLHSFLLNRIAENPYKNGEQFFTGLLHKKLSPIILKYAQIPPGKTAGEYTDKETAALASALQYFKIIIKETNGFKDAQVCAGGILLSELKAPSMESTFVPGLYFCGELVDADGACGGYNLQWAWSSGYAAGYHCARKGGG